MLNCNGGRIARRVLPLVSTAAGWALLVAAIVAGTGSLGLMGSALAGPVTAQVNSRWTIVPNGGVDLYVRATDAPVFASTKFAFHPAIAKSTKIGVFTLIELVNPQGVRHEYTKTEDHGTTGYADHDLSIESFDFAGLRKYSLRDHVEAVISPGKNEQPQKVSIHAAIDDPFAFSNTSADAVFGFDPAGVTMQFSLEELTAFPGLFATSPGDAGAIADDTQWTVRFRVAPGVITDPETFWSDGLSGAIDMVTLKLQSDAASHVTATLATGASSGDFLVDTSGVAGAKAAIEGAFDGAGGQLPGTLEDVFSVSFAPQGGVTEYTIGVQPTLDLAAWELAVVPEPSSAAMAALGMALIAVALRFGRTR
ncbi:MAG: PEP-CTERM sorting domain-containing protein [Pirellulales bacterium]|nr:PEP-CTERM sorting domain-containing protein [Pirellulales bacterium]